MPVEATWGVYQGIVAAYSNPDRRAGKTVLTKVIDSISTGMPAALSDSRPWGAP